MVPNETGVGIIEVFLHFVEGFFIFLCLLSQLDGNICLMSVCCEDKGFDDGSVCRYVQVVGFNEVADTVRGESSQRLIGVEGEGSVAGTRDGYLREIMRDEAIWTRDCSGTSGVGRGFSRGMDGMI